jgi:hypothetical protein
MTAAVDLSKEIGIQPACDLLYVSRTTFYRCLKPKGPQGRHLLWTQIPLLLPLPWKLDEQTCSLHIGVSGPPTELPLTKSFQGSSPGRRPRESNLPDLPASPSLSTGLSIPSLQRMSFPVPLVSYSDNKLRIFLCCSFFKVKFGEVGTLGILDTGLNSKSWEGCFGRIHVLWYSNSPVPPSHFKRGPPIRIGKGLDTINFYLWRNL